MMKARAARFGLAGLLCAAATAVAVEPVPDTMTLQEVMSALVVPASDALWGVDGSPLSAEQWAELDEAGLALAEAARALLLPGRAVSHATEAPEGELPPAEIAKRIQDQPDQWSAAVGLLDTAAAEARQAIAGEDADGLLMAGGTLYDSCEGCHRQFWYPSD